MSNPTLPRAGDSEPSTSAEPEPATGTGGTRGSRPDLRLIGGMPIWIFAALLAVVVATSLTGTLEPGMLSGFAVTMTMGWLLMWIGNSVPVLRDFGLPVVLCVFVPATLAYAGLIPESLTTTVQAFASDQGFLDFVVIAVIAGSILGMPRSLLINAGVRYAVPVIGTVLVVFAAIGALGAATGFGFIRAILFIAAPIMAGGLPIGALPMSQMYANQLGGQPDALLGGLVSAVVVANIVCIICAAVLNGIGKRRSTLFVGFTGNGKLLRITSSSEDLSVPKTVTAANTIALAQGLAIAGILLLLGTMLGHFLPSLHPYAWTTILAVAAKVFRLLPKTLEDSASAWGDMAATAFVPALLTALSLAVMNIGDIIKSLGDIRFILLTVCTVLLAGLAAGTLGYLVKFYFIEAAITPGLVMADTGGSGDVAVLSAAERMYLMPFATVANRVGGVFVLLLTSALVPLLTSAG